MPICRNNVPRYGHSARCDYRWLMEEKKISRNENGKIEIRTSIFISHCVLRYKDLLSTLRESEEKKPGGCDRQPHQTLRRALTFCERDEGCGVLPDLPKRQHRIGYEVRRSELT